MHLVQAQRLPPGRRLHQLTSRVVEKRQQGVDIERVRPAVTHGRSDHPGCAQHGGQHRQGVVDPVSDQGSSDVGERLHQGGGVVEWWGQGVNGRREGLLPLLRGGVGQLREAS